MGRKNISLLSLFLMPCLAYLLVWRVYPLFYTIFLSLHSWNLISSPRPTFIGIDNYVKVLSSSRFFYSLKITVLFTILSTAAELLLGLGIALLLNIEKVRGKNTVRSLVLVPMFLTPAIIGTLWYIMYHEIIGPINYFLTLIGVGKISWLSTFRTAFIAIVISDIWQWTPFIVLLLLAGLQIIPQEVYEASEIDGAAWHERFRYITLPFLKYNIGICLLLRSMDAFREFDKPYVLTHGGPGDSTELVTLLIKKIGLQFYDIGYASAMVVVVLILFTSVYSLPTKRFQIE